MFALMACVAFLHMDQSISANICKNATHGIQETPQKNEATDKREKIEVFGGTINYNYLCCILIYGLMSIFNALNPLLERHTQK